MYYECHITMEGFQQSELANDPNQTRKNPSGLLTVFGWKFSTIDGDPSLGVGPRDYLTSHYTYKHNNLPQVITEMNFIARLLNLAGVKVIRQKVELVVYDTKVGKEGK